MAVLPIPFPTQTYRGSSKPLSSQRLLNMLIEPSQDGNVAGFMLFGAPGLRKVMDLSLLLPEGFVPLGMEDIFNPIDNKWYIIYATNSGVFLIEKGDPKPTEWVQEAHWNDFTIIPPTSVVKFASNGNDVILLNKDAGRILVVSPPTAAGNPWRIDEPNGGAYTAFISAGGKFTDITQIMSVFVATTTTLGNATIRWGAVLDPDSWDYVAALDFAPNLLTGLASNGREIWVFSPTDCAVLSPGGPDLDNFFQAVQGATINKGTVYASCIAVDQSSFLFYAANDCIYMSTGGYGLKQISTTALIDMIKSWGSPKDMIGQFYYKSGHTYYIMKFKFDEGRPDKCLWYDIEANSWTEREGLNGTSWRGDYLVRFATGETYITSVDEAAIYELDKDYYTDTDIPIPREFVFPSIVTDKKRRILYYSLTLDMDVGLGPNDEVWLDWSDDGGYTWEKPRRANLGEHGEYAKRIQFRRLGSALNRIFRVKMVTNSPVHVLAAWGEGEECDA